MAYKGRAGEFLNPLYKEKDIRAYVIKSLCTSLHDHFSQLASAAVSADDSDMLAYQMEVEDIYRNALEAAKEKEKKKKSADKAKKKALVQVKQKSGGEFKADSIAHSNKESVVQPEETEETNIFSKEIPYDKENANEKENNNVCVPEEAPVLGKFLLTAKKGSYSLMSVNGVSKR